MVWLRGPVLLFLQIKGTKIQTLSETAQCDLHGLKVWQGNLKFRRKSSELVVALFVSRDKAHIACIQ